MLEIKNLMVFYENAQRVIPLILSGFYKWPQSLPAECQNRKSQGLTLQTKAILLW